MDLDSVRKLVAGGESEKILDSMHASTRWELLPVPDGIGLADLDGEEILITLENAVRMGRMEQPRRIDLKSILVGLKRRFCTGPAWSRSGGWER